MSPHCHCLFKNYSVTSHVNFRWKIIGGITEIVHIFIDLLYNLQNGYVDCKYVDETHYI